MRKEGKFFFISTFILFISQFLSRILGLLRTTLINANFGATEGGGISDCFSASFKIPDIIFNVIAFGVISVVLVPYFSKYLKNKKYNELTIACSNFINIFLIIIGFFIIIGFIFTPFIVKNILVKGWSNEANIQLTIKMTRILFLQVFFMTLSGILASFLNSVERVLGYIFYALAPLFYNLGIIFGIVFIAPYIGIEGVAWGTVIGGLLHLIINLIGSIIYGYRYKPVAPKFDKDIKELFLIGVPRIIGISGEQFVKFFIVIIASYLIEGSMIIFDNAENFSMIAYGMIAVSISTTSFPIFSKLFIEEKYSELLNKLFEVVRSSLFFIVPITAIMIVLRIDIVDIFLNYKRITRLDVIYTANSLGLYMIGIPFFSITLIIAKFYYAHKESFIPMIITLITVLITVFCCYIFSKKYSLYGLSIGRSIGYIIQTLLLTAFLMFIYMKNKIKVIINWQPIVDVFKILIVSVILFVFGIFLSNNLNFIDFQKQVHFLKLNSILRSFIIGGIFSIFYILIMYLLKIPEIRSIINKRIKE